MKHAKRVLGVDLAGQWRIEFVQELYTPHDCKCKVFQITATIKI